ncbi:MAG: hypothetical protein LVQ64_00305 [Thermoplasmatales archaeon]|nr:hypothetical protein [Thermoplasmatales archaeon]
MAPRDTSTGDVLEQMVLPALRQGGYQVTKHVKVGTRPGGGKHIVDVVAGDGTGRAILIELKWQQTAGTTEQKIPFEVMCLARSLKEGRGRYAAAYLVLGGDGWTLREFYIRGGLNEYLSSGDSVKIMGMESFIAKANKREL